MRSSGVMSNTPRRIEPTTTAPIPVVTSHVPCFLSVSLPFPWPRALSLLSLVIVPRPVRGHEFVFTFAPFCIGDGSSFPPVSSLRIVGRSVSFSRAATYSACPHEAHRPAMSGLNLSVSSQCLTSSSIIGATGSSILPILPVVKDVSSVPGALATCTLAPQAQNNRVVNPSIVIGAFLLC